MAGLGKKELIIVLNLEEEFLDDLQRDFGKRMDAVRQLVGQLATGKDLESIGFIIIATQESLAMIETELKQLKAQMMFIATDSPHQIKLTNPDSKVK